VTEFDENEKGGGLSIGLNVSGGNGGAGTRQKSGHVAIDLRLIDAAKDLYASGWAAFRRVVLPLSLPGIFAGTLLTFIPAAGDFVNARFLGGPNNTMIGTVVQDRFLVQLDYPSAAALSFVLMIIITIGTLIYARALGTDDLV
jgi:spermidine/putrescine transport system permease protein